MSYQLTQKNNFMSQITYTLQVTETGKKSAKFFYQVINDTTGEVVTTRNSNREYVACTINGAFFFGRLDLIGKGDHGRYLKDIAIRPEHWSENGVKFQIIAYKK